MQGVSRTHLPPQNWIADFLQVGHRHLRDRVKINFVQFTLGIGKIGAQTLIMKNDMLELTNW